MREKRGLSQKEIARLMGMLRTSLVNIEYGRQNIHIAMLAKFAAIYGVEIADLVAQERAA